jgi:hypothetical protein
MVDLDKVLTFSEAAEKWGFSNGSTLRKAVERNKFYDWEIKRSGNVWLTTYDAMERVFGIPKHIENAFIIKYLDLSKIICDIYIPEKSDEAKEKLKDLINRATLAIEDNKFIRFTYENHGEEKSLTIIRTKEELDAWLNRAKYYIKVSNIL